MRVLSTTQQTVYQQILQVDAEDIVDRFLMAEAAKTSWEQSLQYFPKPPVSRSIRELILLGNREVYRILPTH